MRSARCACAVAAALTAVAFTGPASALATPVDGGGSFDDAPTLRAGTYTDTILPQETLFYAVAVHAGQRLKLDAVVDLSVGSHSNTHGIPDALGGFGVTLYSPLHERLPSVYDGDPTRSGESFQTDRYKVAGPRVRSTAAADRAAVDKGDDWTGPGIYHFTAAISQFYGDLGAVVEFRLRLQIALEGPASSSDAPEPGPLGVAAAPVAEPAVSPPSARPARSEEHASASLTLLLAGGAAGLGVGVIVVVVIATVARRGQARPMRDRPP